MDSPGKNTGVGCYALLLGIFPTQGSHPRLLRLLHRKAGSLPGAPDAPANAPRSANLVEWPQGGAVLKAPSERPFQSSLDASPQHPGHPLPTSPLPPSGAETVLPCLVQILTHGTRDRNGMIIASLRLGWFVMGQYIVRTEKAMAPHSSTLAWKIPWTKEPGGLQSMGSRRVGHD